MKFPNLPAAGALTGAEVVPVTQGGVDSQTTAQDIADLAGSTPLTINTEASTSTMTPATHAGLAVYNRCADDVTFNTTEGYAAGEVYNLRATAGLTLIGTGVTLTPPAGGTLAMDTDMSVTIVMTSGAAGDVIGQTVPA